MEEVEDVEYAKEIEEVEEKQPNHGFWLYGDSKDWMLKAHYSESPEEGKRPALAIIYVPAS